MKASKREITLNEVDSLWDMLTMEKAILAQYCAAISSAERKETRTELVGAFSSVAEEIFLLCDLLGSMRSGKAKY